MLRDDFFLTKSIVESIQIIEQDELAEHLVPMFEIVRGTTTFIEILIKKEVAEASKFL